MLRVCRRVEWTTPLAPLADRARYRPSCRRIPRIAHWASPAATALSPPPSNRAMSLRSPLSPRHAEDGPPHPDSLSASSSAASVTSAAAVTAIRLRPARSAVDSRDHRSLVLACSASGGTLGKTTDFVDMHSGAVNFFGVDLAVSGKTLGMITDLVVATPRSGAAEPVRAWHVARTGVESLGSLADWPATHRADDDGAAAAATRRAAVDGGRSGCQSAAHVADAATPRSGAADPVRAWHVARTGFESS